MGLATAATTWYPFCMRDRASAGEATFEHKFGIVVSPLPYDQRVLEGATADVESRHLDEYERRADVIDAGLDYVESALAHRLTILSCPCLRIGACECGWTSPVVELPDFAVVADLHASHVAANL